MDWKGKHVNLRVIFLDDQVHAFQVHVKAFGQVLWDAVVRHLNLLETDYFDLEYEDARGLQCWLDREKAILKQLPNPDRPLYFLVKFYTPDPTLLEDELTRYLLALQIKRDLMRGNLPCSENTVALLISYVVQAEIGDYPIEEYEDHTYLSAYGLKYVPNQTEALERKICDYHKQHVGETPAEADANLLDTARKVDLYGIRVSPAKDHEGVPLNLAVASMGILVFQGITKINTFSWAKIRKLSFKRKKFLIKLHPENYGYYKDLVEFFFETRDECKGFWKKCIEHHTFFRCHAVKKMERHKTRVISRGSSFRYSGRTQKELSEFIRDQYVKRQPFQRTVSGRISSRSTSVTPKIPAKTSSLHNSADLHNSTASSGSHILDQSTSNHQLTNQVESVDVHSDSSLSGSRSLGSLGLPRSPKKDEGQGHNEEVAEPTNGATDVPDVPYPRAEGTGTVIQEEHRDKGGYIMHSNISNQSLIIVECHNFREMEYAAAADDKNEEAKVGTVDNTQTQSANQNANDNDDNISQASYHLEGEGHIDYQSASSSAIVEVAIGNNNPLTSNGKTNITYTPDSTHDALCGTENRANNDRVPLESYSLVKTLSIALEETKTIPFSDLPHACILQEVEKLTMGREVIVETANLTQTVEVANIKMLSMNDMPVKAKVTLTESNIRKPMQEDCNIVDRNTEAGTCVTVKPSIKLGDENVEPSKSNKNNQNVHDHHNDVERDDQRLMNQFNSCKKSIEYGTDLIEDIPYFLHRRHVQVGLEQRKEAELYTALENALNSAYHSSSAAYLQRGRSAKRPANMQIQQLKANELPTRSASMPAGGSKRMPSQSPIRKTSRIFASKGLDRSLSEKRSPISKESLSRSRSPSCHRRLELVSFHRLPRKDNFSSVDDTANIGTDIITSPRNQKFKIARGKVDNCCADISVSSPSKSTDISMSSPSESSYSGSVYLASMSTDSSPSPTQTTTASTASTSSSSVTSIASIKSSIVSNRSPSLPVDVITQFPDDSISYKSRDALDSNRCREDICKETETGSTSIGQSDLKNVTQVYSAQRESSFLPVSRNMRDSPIHKETNVTWIQNEMPVLQTQSDVSVLHRKSETEVPQVNQELITSKEQFMRTLDRKDVELDNFPAPLSCSTPLSPISKSVTDPKEISSTAETYYISLDSLGNTRSHTNAKELDLEVKSLDLCENDIKVYDDSGTNLKSPSDLESPCSVAAMLLTQNSTGNSSAQYGCNVVTFSTFKPQEMDDKSELKSGSSDAKLAGNQDDVFNNSMRKKFEKEASLSLNVDGSYHSSRQAVRSYNAVIHRSISPRRSVEYMKRVSQGSPEVLKLSFDVTPRVKDEVVFKRHSYHGETEEALQEREQRRKKSEPKRVSFHETVEEIADAAWMAMLSPTEDEPSGNMDGSLETQTSFEPDFFLHLDASGPRDRSSGSCYDDVLDVLEDLEGYSENFCSSTDSPGRSGSESDDESEMSEDDDSADEFFKFAKSLAGSGKETTLDSGVGIDMSDSFGTNQDTSPLSPLDPLEKLEELFDLHLEENDDSSDPKQKHELNQPKLVFDPVEELASSSGDEEDIEVSKKEKRASIDPLESLEDPSVAAVVTSSDESSEASLTRELPNS